MKKKHVIMLVEPIQGNWKYSILKDGPSISGKAVTVDGLIQIQKQQKPDEVFMEEGFRTLECRSIAKQHGWTLTKSCGSSI